MLTLLRSIIDDLIPPRRLSAADVTVRLSDPPSPGDCRASSCEAAHTGPDQHGNHPSYELLDRYSRRDLSDQVVRAVENHLEQCESCRAQLEYVTWFNQLAEKTACR